VKNLGNISEQANNILDNIAGKLEIIARKLGIALEHLWGILIRQAYVDGIVSITLSIVFLLIIFLMIKIVPKTIKKISKTYFAEVKGRKEDSTGYDYSRDVSSMREDFASFSRYLVPVISVITGIVLLILAITNAVSGVARLINPEWYALRMILEKLQ
jgi:hypothetical protein